MKKTIIIFSALLLLSCGTRKTEKSEVKEETTEVITKKDSTAKVTDRKEETTEDKKSKKETKNNVVTETKIIEIDGRITETRIIDNTITKQVDVSHYQQSISVLERTVVSMQLQIDKLSKKQVNVKETEKTSATCFIWLFIVIIAMIMIWFWMRKNGWFKN